jgi:hypothetical protein
VRLKVWLGAVPVILALALDPAAPVLTVPIEREFGVADGVSAQLPSPLRNFVLSATNGAGTSPDEPLEIEVAPIKTGSASQLALPFTVPKSVTKTNRDGLLFPLEPPITSAMSTQPTAESNF